MYSHKKIFAHGCSVTHGSDLVSGGIDPKNTHYAFPNILANILSLPCENLALPGASNENIFHEALKSIYGFDNTILIVCWTTLVRESWRNNGKNFNVNINWASANLSNEKQKVYYDEKNNVSSVDRDDLNDLGSYLQFFKKHKNDMYFYFERLKHYSKIIRDLCKNKQIKLIELQYGDILIDCDNLCLIGNWFSEARHPNMQEHKLIAEFIYEKSFC